MKGKKNYKIFMLLWITLALLISESFCYSSPGPNFNKKIQRIIDKNRRKYHLIGVEVSISFPDENLPRDFVSGSATIDLTIPLTPNHLFQIGSETKSFIAAILLQLEHEGYLLLDSPISNWIPGLMPDWEKITIKQLLNHTSGIASYTETEEFWYLERESDFEKAWSTFDLINLVEEKPLDFYPGYGWHYSDTNYILAGMIISAVTGKTVEEELKSRILEPLHLDNTHYFLTSPSSALLLQMAHGYYEQNNNLPYDATYVNLSMANAAGALVSSSHDTAIWLRKLLTTQDILSIKQRKKMMTIVDYQGQPGSGAGSGLGIFLDYNQYGGEVWSHTGGMPGYLSSMLWLRSQDVVITILVNSNNNEGSAQLWQDLINYINVLYKNDENSVQTLN